MTAKEKAIELVYKYENLVTTWDCYWDTEIPVDNRLPEMKQCALVAVEEILDLNLGLSNCDEENWAIDKFYLEVKQEIEKL